MLLTPELAQPIVDRAMAILQRNVNMMDGNGFIVGSGDPSRVGDFHQGADAVLRTGRRVEIHPEDVAHWGGVRMGVNLPLRLDGRIVGVVGITGAPDEVRPFGELIREMVQLMLAQARSAEMERTVALAREAFLRDLLTGAEKPSLDLLHEARLHGLNDEGIYTVVLYQPPSSAAPGDWSWVKRIEEKAASAAGLAQITPLLAAGPWEGRLVLVTGNLPAAMVSQLYNPASGSSLAVGLPAQGPVGLRRSYRTALLALQAGRRLHGAGLFSAGSMHLETMLATVAQEDAAAFVAHVLGELPQAASRQGQSARETIDAYLRSGMSLSEAAAALQIHRHTLMYRLDQIAAATGLDARAWDGAVRLYLALMLERLFGQNVDIDP